MGFIQLPIIDQMPFPPLLANLLEYASKYVTRSHMGFTIPMRRTRIFADTSVLLTEYPCFDHTTSCRDLL